MLVFLIVTLFISSPTNALEDSIVFSQFDDIRPHIKNEPNSNIPWEDDIFLPRDVEPLHYDLYLYPNLEDKTLTGKVNIWIKTKSEKKYLYLHSKYLQHEQPSQLYLGKVPLGSEGNATEAVKVVSTFQYEPHQFLVVEAESAIPPGEYTWHLDFTGSLDNPQSPLKGFYLSNYSDPEGNIRYKILF